MSTFLEAEHITSGPAFERLGLVHRVRVPQADGRHPTLVMLHGLEGTEDVTWIFARAAGPQWLIISPRAPIPARDGFSWNALNADGRTHKESYKVGFDALNHFMEALPSVYPVDQNHIVLLGFSQGAAMAYAFGTANPVTGIAALAGFIPPHLELPPLHGLPILILHGTKDDTISIETAHRDRDQLVEAGADVTYQESEVGHKVSSAGFAELKRWLAARL